MSVLKLVGGLSFTAYQTLWVIQCQIRFTYMNYIWFVTIFYMNSPFLRKLTFLLNSCFDPFDPQVGRFEIVDEAFNNVLENMSYNWVMRHFHCYGNCGHESETNGSSRQKRVRLCLACRSVIWYKEKKRKILTAVSIIHLQPIKGKKRGGPRPEFL